MEYVGFDTMLTAIKSVWVDFYPRNPVRIFWIARDFLVCDFVGQISDQQPLIMSVQRCVYFLFV